MMTELNQDTVPEFLRKSDLYKNFDFTNNESVFTIPDKYVKFDTNVNTFDDLVSLLHVLRFWLIDETPFEIFDFVIKNNNKLDYSSIYEEFDGMKAIEEIKILNREFDMSLKKSEEKYDSFRFIEKNEPKSIIDYVIRNGYMNLVKYFNQCNFEPREDDFNLNKNSSYWALLNGHFEIFEYILDNGCELNEACLKFSCQDKDIRFLTYLLKPNKFRQRFYDFSITIGSKDNSITEKSKYYTHLKFAAESGILDNIKLLRKRNFDWNIDFMQELAYNGYIECIKYAHENGCPWDVYTCEVAARNGKLECLKYLHENGCPWNHHTTTSAGNNGNLDCLKYAYENGCLVSQNLLLNSLYNKNLEIFKYAYENDFPPLGADDDSDIMEIMREYVIRIFSSGKYNFVKYMIENNFPYDEYFLWIICYKAKSDNNQEFLDYVFPLCNRSIEMVREACRFGNLQQLNFLIENGCEMDESCCEEAASEGRLDFLEYLHENGCPWDKTTCLAAVENDNEECLKYAHEKGCPIDEETAYMSALNDSTYCLDYLLKNNCPMNGATSHAAENGSMASLILLKNSKVEWDEDTVECCIRNYHDDCLKFVLENNAPCSDNMIVYAGIFGNFEAMQILYKNGCNLKEDFCEVVQKNVPQMTSTHSKCLFFAIEKGCTPVNFTSVELNNPSDDSEIEDFNNPSENSELEDSNNTTDESSENSDDD